MFPLRLHVCPKNGHTSKGSGGYNGFYTWQRYKEDLVPTIRTPVQYQNCWVLRDTLYFVLTVMHVKY
jgi:hypothetical protein